MPIRYRSKAALNDLYHAGNMQDYVMYMGSNVTLTAATVANNIPSTVDATNATFASLKDKVNKLVITGHSDDPITQDLTVPSGAKHLLLLRMLTLVQRLLYEILAIPALTSI